MIRKIFTLLSILFTALSLNAQTETNDTIMTASTAGELRVRTDNSGIALTVRNIDGKGENFYYTTTSSNPVVNSETNVTEFKHIKDIKIVEIAGRKIMIEFENESSDANTLYFDIPDHENREVKSYTGQKYREFGINLSNQGKSQWNLISTGLGLGWLTPTDSAPDMNTSMGRSMEWSWLMVLGVSWDCGPHSISAGIGLDWRNYTMKNSRYFYKEDDGSIGFRSFEEGVTKGKSRILVFGLQVPMLYNFKFGKGRKFGLTAGPVLNFNTGGNIKTQYEYGGSKYKITTGKIHQTPVTVDLLAACTWEGIGVYARYAPMKVLRSRSGLSFNSFSTGIILLF